MPTSINSPLLYETAGDCPAISPHENRTIYSVILCWIGNKVKLL